MMWASRVIFVIFCDNPNGLQDIELLTGDSRLRSNLALNLGAERLNQI